MPRGFEQDPLTLAAMPPPDETPAQRIVREKAELEAKRVSDEIDELIKAEKAATKRRKRPVKVLLLGQSESGTSSYLYITLRMIRQTYQGKSGEYERYVLEVRF